MAVKAGYSKIATSGSVFIYDTGDTINSYVGEPTTNLAPYSQDFTQWGGNLFGNWINSAVTLNASYAPDGTYTANRFGNGYSRYTNSIAATTSTTYTFSVWLKNVSLTGDGVLLYWSFGLNGGLVSYGNGLSIGIGTLTNQWQRFTFTVTSPSSGINQLQFGVVTFTGYGGNNSGQQVDVWGGQVEQKSHMTQYLPTTTTSATRSNTQGLLDISGRGNSISLADVSFDANAMMTFDGTNDVIDISTNFGTLSQYTVEHVSYKGAEGKMPFSYRTNTNFYQYGDYSWAYTHGGVWGEFYYNGSNYNGQGPINGWGHWVITYDGSKVSVYRRGQLTGTQNTTGTADWSGGFKIGYWAGGGAYAWLGQIAVVKFYNRALSASEVLSNYNHYKTRFNIT